MEKTTFRLPEWELETMRERSRRERRSLNTVVAEVIAVGLGQAPAAQPNTVAAALGPLLFRPAKAQWQPGARETASPVQLTDALDWSRGD